MSSKNKKNTNGAAKKSAVSAEEKLEQAIFGEPKKHGYAQIMVDASAAIGKILAAIDKYSDSSEHMKEERLTLLEKIGIKGVYDRIMDAQEIADNLVCCELDRIEHERKLWKELEADEAKVREEIRLEKVAKATDAGKKAQKKAKANVVKVAKVNGAKAAKSTKAVRDAQGHFAAKAAK